MRWLIFGFALKNVFYWLFGDDFVCFLDLLRTFEAILRLLSPIC